MTKNASGVHQVSGTAKDQAGNESAPSEPLTVRVDATAPTIACTCPRSGPPGSERDGHLERLRRPLRPGGPGQRHDPSGHEHGRQGQDRFGGGRGDQGQRRASQPGAATCSYSIAYAFGGFFQPVDNPPTLNGAKAGSAVPVKFSLRGNQGLDVFASGYPLARAFACDSGAPFADVEETVAAGASSLAYDAGADRYQYVWKTDPGWAGPCRQLVVRLNDGSEHVANFKFK